MSCKDPERGTPTCADLDVLVGKSELSFSSGNTIGYRMLTTDVDTANGLDMFPFDTYTVKGIVRVSVSPCTAAATDWPLLWLQMAEPCCAGSFRCRPAAAEAAMFVAGGRDRHDPDSSSGSLVRGG